MLQEFIFCHLFLVITLSKRPPWFSYFYAMLQEFIFCHLFLVITLWVRSTSALRDFLTSSSSVSGKESIAAAARLACFAASSLVLCIPRLFPRYSRAWIQRQSSSDKLTLISTGKKKNKQMIQTVETIRASSFYLCFKWKSVLQMGWNQHSM